MATNNNSEKSASALHSIFYSNNPLNRMNNKRTEQNYIDDLTQNSSSQFLPFFKLRPHVTKPQDNRRDLAWLSQSQAAALLQDKSKNRTLLFLGTLQDKAYFAFDVDEETSNKFIEQDPTKEFPDMRLSASTLKYEDAAILAQARAYFEWHARHLHCGTCGSKTESQEGGSRRKCTGCGASLYPRTDPVAIVLVTSADGQRCLLGRKKEFPKGIYTCIAGFMEPGESMEDAVVREVKEESDIDVDVHSVEYFASQPWPFGGQLMLGCFARATTETVSVGEGDIAQELEDARWFTLDEAKQAVSAALATDAWLKSTAIRLPPSIAIAHQLVKAWVDKQG
jgi:NAD+ diphosphatase